MNEELERLVGVLQAQGASFAEIQDVIARYQAGGIGDEVTDDKNPEEVKVEDLSQEDELLRAKEATHQDWWSKNADLGSAADYTQNEDGNWVNSAGEVVLYKEDPWASGSLNPTDIRNIIPAGDGTSYIWRGLASGERSKELAEQLEKQKGEREFIRSVTESGSEVEEDSLETKSKETNRKAQKFFADNEDIVRSDWEYVGDGVIRNTSNSIEYSGSNLPNGDKRYLELIDILKSEDEIAGTEDKQARESGSLNIDKITKDHLNRRENLALDALNNTNLEQMGFTVTDEDVEAGKGELTITSNIDPTKVFKIATGGGASAEDIELLNEFLKTNAYDAGSALDANIRNTGVTFEQAENNRNEAVAETAELIKRKTLQEEFLGSEGNKDLQDNLKTTILNDGAIALGYESYDAMIDAAVSDAGLAMKADARTNFFLTEKGRALMQWVKDNLSNYSEAVDLGFKVDSQGFARVAGTTTVRIEGDILKTGYEANEDFLGDRSEESRIHDDAVEREGKRQFIDKVNKYLSEDDRELNEDQERAIMNAPVDNGYLTFSALPQDLFDLLFDIPGLANTSITDDIDPANPNVLSEVENALTGAKNGESIKQNIYDNIEGRSGNWWSDEEFKDNLEEAAAKRWEELKEEDKRLVAASEELRGNFEENSRLLESALEELNSLTFDGMSAQDAIDAIANGEYASQEEADAAKARASEIASAYNTAYRKVKTYLDANETYLDLTLDMRKDLDDLELEIDDLSWYKDVITDRTALGFQAADAFLNGVVELGQGFLEIGGALADVGVWAVSRVWAQLDRPFGLDPEKTTSAVDDWYATTAFGDRRVQTYIDEWQAEGVMGERAQTPVSLDDVDSFGDFGEWAAVTLSGQAPQLALMFATSGLGSLYTRGAVAANTMSAARATALIEQFTLGTMGFNAAGNKYKALREENELFKATGGLYGNSYTLAEMLLAAGGTGLVEALSEKVTFDLMKGAGGAFSKSARIDALAQMKDGFGTYLRREFLSSKGINKSLRSLGMTGQEGLSEGLATIGENMFDIGLGKEAHIFDNIEESILTGVMIGGAMSTPALYGRMIRPFQSIDAKREQATLHANERAVGAEIRRLVRESADPEIIQEKRDALVEIQSQLAQLKEFETKRVDLFTDSEKRTLINLDRTNLDLSRKYKQTQNNEDLTAAERTATLEKLENQYSDNVKKADKIINQYDVNVVNKKYEQRIKRTEQLAKYAQKDGGVEVNSREFGSQGFIDFVAEHNKPEEVEAEINRLRLVSEDSSKSDKERSVAAENVRSMESYLKLAASKDASGSYGAMVPIIENGKLTRFEIAINKNKAIVDGKFATATHEFQHAVLYNTIKQDAGIQDVLGAQISDLVTSKDTKFSKPENEDEYWDRVGAYEAEGRGEEQLTVFSEMIDEGKVKFNDGIAKKLGRYVRHIQARLGMRDFKFDTQEDIKDFITSYHRTVNAKFGRNIALERMQRKGAKGKLVDQGKAITERRNAQKAKHKETKAKIAFSRALDRAENSSPDMKETFDKFVQNNDGTRKYDSKDDFNASIDRSSAALEILEGRALDGLIQQGMTDLGLPPQALREFTREVKEELMDRFLTQFDPAKNDSLFGWLTGVSGGRGMSQIYRAKGDVMNRYKTQVDTVSIDAPMGEDQSFADTLVDTGAGAATGDSIGLIEDTDGLTIFLDSINASPETIEAINKVVADANVDITGLTYKDVKKLTTGKNAPLSGVLDIVAEDFGVPPAKIIKPADLNTVQRASAQEFIKNNAQALIDMLPEGETRSGQATGVANTKLGNLYVKGERLSMAEGATAAGKFSQNKREDISVEEFNSLFGINPDGTFDNSRKHDGAIKALVNQAAMITANQTLRQQAIETESNPLSQIAMLGEGKGAMMFSKQGQKSYQQLGRLLPELQSAVFLDRTQSLAENILAPLTTVEEDAKNQKAKDKFSKDNIRGAVVSTYGDIFNEQQLNKLVNAIHAVATSNRIPKTDKGKVSRNEALTTELNRLILDNDSKVKTWFGTGLDNIALFNDPKKIELHRGLTVDFAIKESIKISKANSNPLIAGIKILESITMLRQQMSTAGKVGGKRAQFFLGKEFLEIMNDNVPDLSFSIKKDGSGFKIDFSKPITYKGQALDVKASDFKLDAQTGMSVLKNFTSDFFNNTNQVQERADGVKKAREHMNNYVSYYVDLYNNGIIGAEDLQMAAANLLSNMNPSLARAAMPRFVAEDMLPPNWKNMSEKAVNAWMANNLKGGLKPVFEHMQPRLSVVLNLFEAHLFEGGVSDVDLHFASYDVAIISDKMDKALKTVGLNNSLAEGQTIDMESWIRYYNDDTISTGEMKSLIGIGNNADVTVGEGHQRASEILRAKREAMRENALANNMLLYSRSATEGSKGISVLDFDDTLATTKSQVIVNAPDGSQFKLNAEEFAKQGADLLAEGNVFDFSEFNKVVKGETAPLFNKALKLASKFTTKDMFILTARAPESQPAIKQFLDANGLNIPMENIVGLGKSEASAKADWIAGKIGEGYNDFYFADDAIQNVDAVKEMLDQHDVKGKVQQAKLKFSLEAPKRLSDIIDEGAAIIDSDFNIILEETKGVGRQKKFSAAKARKRGKNKGKFKFFIPPSADDFAGLMYAFMGKGKTGEKHHKFFKVNLFDPFSKGIRHLNMAKQAIANDVKKLRQAMPGVRKMLTKNVPGTEYTYQDAIRVYNWDKQNFETPGLSNNDKALLLRAVNSDSDVKAFADGISSIAAQAPESLTEPGDHWLSGTIASDLNDSLKNARKTYLKQWIDNKNIIFNEANMNKIEAVYGSNFREALEDLLYRMEDGGNRSRGAGRLLNNFTNWIHGSIGTTMFFNARSAVLQMISNVNFINWSDNNMLKAAGAFANQPQYWKDVSMIFNSPFLKQRRAGLQTDVNAAELLAQIKDSKNKMKAATAYLLQLGFTPTQIADSLAIATGGATMYRNRTNTYVKEGMSQKDAESKAFEDMMEIAEETQQSAREDRISQQQASPLGKFILAFQNTPMQYNRLIKKAAMDLVNGRGDQRANLSKIVYYGAIQNMIFYGLQQALWASLFGGDEDDELDDKKKGRVINGMLDTLLRGAGIGGAVVSTIKNLIIKFAQESEKMDDTMTRTDKDGEVIVDPATGQPKQYDNFFTDPDWGNVVIEALNISPPIGIKARKIYSGLKTWEYNNDIINHMDKTDIDNPMYDAMFSVTEAVTNLPLSRLYNKYQNISEAANAENETWQRVAMLLGWSRWSFGIKNQDVMTAKNELKEIKEKEKEEKKEQNKRDREMQKLAEEEVEIEDNLLDQDEQREQGAEEVQCAAVSRSGKRCSNMALPGENFCTIHMPVPQQQNEVQCSHIKDNGERCKMKTKNKSGKCYYHD
jgi:hypothetical protein